MLLWRVVRMVPLSFRSWFLDIRRDPVLGAAVERFAALWCENACGLHASVSSLSVLRLL
mgnify:CR=1 FL=1